MSINITTQNFPNHPNFKVPNFRLVDFGIAADGQFSYGYKMIAFEPGKILQAQELNELQFRMNAHQNLTSQMLSNWLNFIIISGTASSTGPGWDGCTPISPNNVKYRASTGVLIIERLQWYLCKANSNGLFFWLYLDADVPIEIQTNGVPLNNYIGFTLNTTANREYTGELVNCNSIGAIVGTQGIKHPLNMKNTSSCGSSRYYLRITGIQNSTIPIANNFCGMVQKKEDGLYFLNNIKVTEI